MHQEWVRRRSCVDPMLCWFLYKYGVTGSALGKPLRRWSMWRWCCVVGPAGPEGRADGLERVTAKSGLTPCFAL